MAEVSPEIKKILEQLLQKCGDCSLQQLINNISNDESSQNAGSSASSASTGSLAASQHVETVKGNDAVPALKLTKSRRASVKSSTSEDERENKNRAASVAKDKVLPAVKSHKRSRRPAISSESENEGEEKELPPGKSPKRRSRIVCSGSDNEVQSRLRKAVKAESLVPNVSSNSDTPERPLKQQSPKPITGTKNSEQNMSSGFWPDSKPAEAPSKSNMKNSNFLSKNSAIAKSSRSLQAEDKPRTISASKPLPQIRKASAGNQIKEDQKVAPKQKSNKPQKVDDEKSKSVKEAEEIITLAKSHKTSANVHMKKSKSIESLKKNPIDETQKNLEESIIAKIVEEDKIMKRKLPSSKPLPLSKKRFLKKNENKEASVMPKTLDEIGGMSVAVKNASLECRVIVPRLSKESISKLSPSKLGAVEHDECLKKAAEETKKVELADTTKIKKDLFVKPAIPKLPGNLKKNPSVSSPLNIKSKNVVKNRTSGTKVLPKPDVGREHNPNKVTESNFPDPFIDLYRPKKKVDPLDEFKMDTEALDYEPGAVDDDDTMSLYADSTIFGNVGIARVPEEVLVQKQARDSDIDSVASYGSDDSRRLSDMDSDDDHESDVSANAQPNSNTAEEIDPSTSSFKELGIPVEVYDEHSSASIESGEILDQEDSDPDESDPHKMADMTKCEKQDSSNSHGTVTVNRQLDVKRTKGSDLLVSPNHQSTKECTEKKDDYIVLKRLTHMKDVRDSAPSISPNELKTSGSKAVEKQISNATTSQSCSSKIPAQKIAEKNAETSDLRTLKHQADFNDKQLENERMSTQRTLLPSTPPRTIYPNIQATHKSSHCFVDVDKQMRNMDLPGAQLEAPRRGALLPTPPHAARAPLLRTPDRTPVIAVSPSSPLREAPLLADNIVPVSVRQCVSETKQVSAKSINTLLENIRHGTPEPNRHFSAMSSNAGCSVSIQPIEEHKAKSLHDIDLRQQNVGPRSTQFFNAADNPVHGVLMLYCYKYLTDGMCDNNCGKLHEFPELLWDENRKRVLSFKLVDLMLLSFPYWRKEKFNETVQALGNYCDKVALQEIADNFWLRCCESFPNEMKGIDFHCWKVLAEALSLCALHPALCARMILYKILLHRKRYLDRQYYQIIDKIVEVLFPGFILNQTDLWFSLSLLASLDGYEMEDKVLREILRDTLSEPRNLKEHKEICDYILRSPPMKPHKLEDLHLLHLIHRFLYLLQQHQTNLSLATRLAQHFSIPLDNSCCKHFLVHIQAAPREGASATRFTLLETYTANNNICKEENLNSQHLPAINLHPTPESSRPPSFVRTDIIQNEQNGRNSQESGTNENPTGSSLNSALENNLATSTEVVNVGGAMKNESHPTNLIPDSVERQPSSLKKISPLTIITGASGRCVQQSVSVPEPLQQNAGHEGNTGTIPRNEKASNQSIEVTIARHLKTNKYGLAARCISTWKGDTKKINLGIGVVCTTLIGQEPETRIVTLQNLLQASGMFIRPGKAGDEIKKILIRISLLILDNCLKKGQYSAASEVHETLLQKINPRSVQMDCHSPSHFELMTAWVYVKNDKVKEALDIITSNKFYECVPSWTICGVSEDLKLRNDVCSVIFDHCKDKEEWASPVSKLFQRMLRANAQIDLALFLDDILQGLVRANESETASKLLVESFEFGLLPRNPVTPRHILLCLPSIKDTPAVLHILSQEPFNVALPKSVVGLSTIPVVLPSEWTTHEVQCVFYFLLNCHMANLSCAPEEVPPVVIQLKECPLPIFGQSHSVSTLFGVDPSINAMQERVCRAIKTVLGYSASFQSDRLILNREAVRNYIIMRRMEAEGVTGQSQPVRNSSSRDVPPIYTGRRTSNVHAQESQPYPLNDWQPVAPAERQGVRHQSSQPRPTLAEDSFMEPYFANPQPLTYPSVQSAGYNQYFRTPYHHYENQAPYQQGRPARFKHPRNNSHVYRP